MFIKQNWCVSKKLEKYINKQEEFTYPPFTWPPEDEVFLVPSISKTFYHYRTLSSIEGGHMLSSGKELVEYLKQRLYESEGQTICSIAVRHC